MVKFKITNIRYCVNQEDLDEAVRSGALKLEDFGVEDVEEIPREEIEKWIEGFLPKQTTIKVVDEFAEMEEDDIADNLCGMLSEQLGWLIDEFDYVEV